MTPSLGSGRRERQAFIATLQELCRVGVVPATHGLPVRGRLRLALIDADRGELVAERVLRGEELRDGRFLFLDFAPVAESRGRVFVLVIEPVGELRGEVSLFASTRDLCPKAWRLSGPGDLRFASYHMPHDREGERDAHEQ